MSSSSLLLSLSVRRLLGVRLLLSPERGMEIEIKGSEKVRERERVRARESESER